MDLVTPSKESHKAPRPRFEPRLIHPRNWAMWLAIGFMWFAALLPYSLQMRLGTYLGRGLLRFARRRRDVAEHNLRLCFPDHSEAQRRALLKSSFESLGMAIFETAIAWFWPRRRLQLLATVTGLENLGCHPERSVLLLAMHFTTLEIGAALLSLKVPLDGMYRYDKNPVYDYLHRRCRVRHSESGLLIGHNDLRLMIKALRQKRIVWYAPDFSGGRSQSVFERFFDVPVAMSTATSKLARVGDAVVVPFTQTRLPNGRGYRLTIHEPFADFPSGDERLDAKRINDFFETQIREQPEQYLWALRRFQSQAPDSGITEQSNDVRMRYGSTAMRSATRIRSAELE